MNEESRKRSRQADEDHWVEVKTTVVLMIQRRIL
jgi:hypothetical protein